MSSTKILCTLVGIAILLLLPAIARADTVELYPAAAKHSNGFDYTSSVKYWDGNVVWMGPNSWLNATSWNNTIPSNSKITGVTATCGISASYGGSLSFWTNKTGNVCVQQNSAVGNLTCDLFSKGVNTSDKINSLELACAYDSRGNSNLDWIHLTVNYTVLGNRTAENKILVVDTDINTSRSEWLETVNTISGLGMKYDIVPASALGIIDIKSYDAVIIESMGNDINISLQEQNNIRDAILSGTSFLWIGDGIQGYDTTTLPSLFGINPQGDGSSSNYSIRNILWRGHAIPIFNEWIRNVSLAGAKADAYFYSKNNLKLFPAITSYQKNSSTGKTVYIAYENYYWWNENPDSDKETWGRTYVFTYYLSQILTKPFATLSPYPNGYKSAVILRFEDIHPEQVGSDYINRMSNLINWTYNKLIPINLGVIPIFKNGNTGEIRDFSHPEADALISTLKSAVAKRGTIIAHGYTHQNGTGADDYTGFDQEFWDEDNGLWLPYEEQAKRFKRAKEEILLTFPSKNLSSEGIDFNCGSDNFCIINSTRTAENIIELYPAAAKHSNGFDYTSSVKYWDGNVVWMGPNSWLNATSWNNTIPSNSKITGVTATCGISASYGGSLSFWTNKTGNVCVQQNSAVGNLTCDLFSKGVNTSDKINSLELACAYDSRGNSNLDWIHLTVNYTVLGNKNITVAFNSTYSRPALLKARWLYSPPKIWINGIMLDTSWWSNHTSFSEEAPVHVLSEYIVAGSNNITVQTSSDTTYLDNITLTFIEGYNASIMEAPHYIANSDTFRAAKDSGFSYATESDGVVFPNRNGYKNVVNNSLLLIPETAGFVSINPSASDIENKSHIFRSLYNASGIYYIFYHGFSDSSLDALKSILNLTLSYKKIWYPNLEEMGKWWIEKEQIKIISVRNAAKKTVDVNITGPYGLKNATIKFITPKNAIILNVTLDNKKLSYATEIDDSVKYVYAVVPSISTNRMILYYS